VLASQPQVLLAQRTLFPPQTEYVAALEGLWFNAVPVGALLLGDGREAPARPDEIDVPAREIKVPMMPPTMSTEE